MQQRERQPPNVALQQQRQNLALQQQQEPVPKIAIERALSDVYQKMSSLDPSLRYQNSPKRESFFEIVTGTALSIPWHPWRLAHTLIQLEYEPVPPTKQYSWLCLRDLYYYPGFLGYINNIYKTKGFGALYVGATHTAFAQFIFLSAGNLIRPVVYSQVNRLVVPFWQKGDVPDTEPHDTMTSICIRGSRMFLCSLVTNVIVQVITHPFRVVAVRCMAQTVGGENTYNGIFSSLREIYRTEGMTGLYSGFVPAFLGQIFSITIHSTLWFFFEILAANIPNQVGRLMVKFISVPMLGLLPPGYAYPFFNVSTHMMVNNVRLAAGRRPFSPEFRGWVDCFKHLKARKRLNWGSSILFPRFVSMDKPKNL